MEIYIFVYEIPIFFFSLNRFAGIEWIIQIKKFFLISILSSRIINFFLSFFTEISSFPPLHLRSALSSSYRKCVNYSQLSNDPRMITLSPEWLRIFYTSYRSFDRLLFSMDDNRSIDPDTGNVVARMGKMDWSSDRPRET